MTRALRRSPWWASFRAELAARGLKPDELVLIDACADMSELTNIVDGEETPPPEVVENPTWVVEALVMADQASGGGWKVSEYRQEPRTC